MLELKQVTKVYRGADKEVSALDKVSLNIGPGEFVVIQGPSGSGKSTLLFTAGVLLAPDAGEVLIEGQNPYDLSFEKRAGLRAQKIGFVFQDFHLIPYLSVLENVLVPSLLLKAENSREKADSIVKHFGLEQRSKHVLAELSAGECQRTALARAFMNSPKIIFADEPTGNLDRDNARAVISYLGEFTGQGGIVLLVTHDEYAARYASRTLYLKEGKLVE